MQVDRFEKNFRMRKIVSSSPLEGGFWKKLGQTWMKWVSMSVWMYLLDVWLLRWCLLWFGVIDMGGNGAFVFEVNAWISIWTNLQTSHLIWKFVLARKTLDQEALLLVDSLGFFEDLVISLDWVSLTLNHHIGLF